MPVLEDWVQRRALPPWLAVRKTFRFPTKSAETRMLFNRYLRGRLLENQWATGENEKKKNLYALSAAQAADFQAQKHEYYEHLVKSGLAGLQGMRDGGAALFAPATRTCHDFLALTEKATHVKLHVGDGGLGRSLAQIQEHGTA